MARRPTLRSIRFDPIGLANNAFLRPRVYRKRFRSEAPNEAVNKERFCYGQSLFTGAFAKKRAFAKESFCSGESVVTKRLFTRLQIERAKNRARKR
jgi:hypothetical protein